MIILTELAANKIKQQLERRGRGVGIKIGIKTSGCSGLIYVLEYVDNPLTESVSFIEKGVEIFLDPKVQPYVNGMTMDWVKKGLNEGFEFKNKNEGGRCGCGESWYLNKNLDNIVS
jgi:iron-sulfur cluster assembly protein